MADIDTGGGNAINAAAITERLIAMGVAGVNIEDQVFPKRCGHMEGKQVIPAEEMAGKVRAMADARRAPGSRTWSSTPAPTPAPCTACDEAIRRANLYLEAGADMAFLDGIGTRADIERAVREIHGLLSVNLMDAVTGVKTELIPIPELARLGVARVSIPVASIMVAHKALVDFFTALRALAHRHPRRRDRSACPLSRNTRPSSACRSTASSRTNTCPRKARSAGRRSRLWE